MDIEYFRNEEQFSTFADDGFLDPYPGSSTGLEIPNDFAPNDYEWNTDTEREINGDIALIPMCDMNLTKLNDSTPCKEDFQKIINDLQQFIHVDHGFPIEEPIEAPQENEEEATSHKSLPTSDILNLSNLSDFDITTYLTEPDPTDILESTPVSVATNAAGPNVCTDKTDSAGLPVLAEKTGLIGNTDNAGMPVFAGKTIPGGNILSSSMPVLAGKTGPGRNTVSPSMPVLAGKTGPGRNTVSPSMPVLAGKTGPGGNVLSANMPVLAGKTGPGGNGLSASVPVIAGRTGLGGNSLLTSVPVIAGKTGPVVRTEPEIKIPVRKPKAGVKKIDMKAQRYIVDGEEERERDEQDEIDVETVSECGENTPVLEAGDLHSLLEQFEATQIPSVPVDFIQNDPTLFEFNDSPIVSSAQVPEEILQYDDCMKVNNAYKSPLPQEILQYDSCIKANSVYKSPLPQEILQYDGCIKANSVYKSPLPQEILQYDSCIKANSVYKSPLPQEILQYDSCIKANSVYKSPLPQEILQYDDCIKENTANKTSENMYGIDGMTSCDFITLQQNDIVIKPETVIDGTAFLNEDFFKVEIKPKCEDIKSHSIKNEKQKDLTKVKKEFSENKIEVKGEFLENAMEPCDQKYVQVPQLSNVKLPPEGEPEAKRRHLDKPIPPNPEKLRNVTPQVFATTSQSGNNTVAKKPESTTSFKSFAPQKNPQIIDCLPKELISKISAGSVKRKTISVIDPVPLKKRGGQSEATASNRRDATAGNSRVVTAGNIRPVTAANVRPVTAGNIRDVTAGNIWPVTAGNIRPVTTGNIRPVTAGNSRAVNAGNSLIVAAGSSRENFVNGRRVVTACNRRVTAQPSSSIENVRLDHDYCLSARMYPKNVKVDSGFGSAEEEEVPTIGNQPMVKNADGKMMVSLLKVNSITNKGGNKKKRLNLEEYKKRRVGGLVHKPKSLHVPQAPQAAASPETEDPETKARKHRELLTRMAMEVLKTAPKSQMKPEPERSAPKLPEFVPELLPKVEAKPARKVPKRGPMQADMEMKVSVSIGVNTEPMRRKNLDPLAPVEQLDAIKPLLQREKTKINANSLITSVIENIPRVIASCAPHDPAPAQAKAGEHGEDKVIQYLCRNRVRPETSEVAVQTNISLVKTIKESRYRKRRRSSSSSSEVSSASSSSSSEASSSSSRRERTRRNSNSSRGSSSTSASSRSCTSSRYSARTRSRSRSRSRSPPARYNNRRNNEREHFLEVEERRVVYVGQIPAGTSKDDLKRRFERFGPITNISLHVRDNGYQNDYGFVTFANKLDAYQAKEHGNDGARPEYDLSFGGRRIFCQTTYSDLDNMRDDCDYYQQRGGDNTFDRLLREAQQKLLKRKA